MADSDDSSVPVSGPRCPNYKKDAAGPNNLPTVCKSCADKAHCYPKKKDGAEDDDGATSSKKVEKPTCQLYVPKSPDSSSYPTNNCCRGRSCVGNYSSCRGWFTAPRTKQSPFLPLASRPGGPGCEDGIKKTDRPTILSLTIGDRTGGILRSVFCYPIIFYTPKICK